MGGGDWDMGHRIAQYIPPDRIEPEHCSASIWAIRSDSLLLVAVGYSRLLLDGERAPWVSPIGIIIIIIIIIIKRIAGHRFKIGCLTEDPSNIVAR
jgi:hypothetical protein